MTSNNLNEQKPSNKTSNNLNEHQISIMIVGNVSSPPTRLTLDLLNAPEIKKTSSLSQVPYFTREIKYPYNVLYNIAFSENGYSKIVRFFFDKIKFRQVLKSYSKHTSNNQAQYDDNIKYNIKLMITLLFPTEWPSKYNYTTSYDQFILKKGPELSWKNYVNKFKYTDIKSNFTYITLNGSKYTIIKSIWLNDLYNHPDYFQLIEEYNKYSLWTENAEELINKQIISFIKLLQKKYIPSGKFEDKKSIFYDENIQKLTAQKGEIEPEIKRPGVQRNFDLEQNFKDLSLLLELLNDEERKNLINNLNANSIFLYNEYIQNILKIINDISSKNVARIKIENITVNINNLSKDIKKIFLLQKVLRDYIEPKNINIYIENEDPDIIQLLKTDYYQYMKFIEQIKKLLPPINQSSNENLQNAIKNFSENNDGENVTNGISFKTVLDELYSLKIPSKTDLLYTGLNNININKEDDAKYEIYISLDLLEGEYNDETIKPIKCNYSGLYLGKKLENWLNSNNSGINFKEDKVFLLKQDLTKNTDKNVKNPKAIEGPKILPNKIKKGGMYKTYKHKTYKRKTYNRKTYKNN